MKKLPKAEVTDDGNVLDDIARSKRTKKSVPKEKDPGSSGNTKFMYYFMAVVIIVFGLFIFVGSLIQQTDTPQTLDERHAKNLAGNGGENDYVYNGFSFVREAGLWWTQVRADTRLFELSLHYRPREVEAIPIRGALDDRFFNDTEVYVTFTPRELNMAQMSLAAAELSLSLVNAIGRAPTAACTSNETDACLDRPMITCENTDRAVIYLEESDETEVLFEGNCIRIKGKEDDLVRSTDRLLYQWYGIIQQP